jgi:hypothetical protein
MKHKILVALDGSDESLVTAWLLKKQGHQLRGVMFQVSHDVQVKEALDQQVRDLERKLGIPVQLMDCVKEARDVVSKEVEFAINRHARYEVKTIFHQRFLFPKLFAMKDHFQFDRIATGHQINLQFEPLDNRVQVVQYHNPEEDDAALLVGLTPDQLRVLEFPLGAIPMSMIRKLADELQLSGGMKPVTFEYSSDHPDTLEFIDDDHSTSLGADLLLDAMGFDASIIFSDQVQQPSPDLQPLTDRVIREVWFENASWFSGQDLGFKSKHCSMTWPEAQAPVAAQVLQSEGSGLKAILDQPLTDQAANLFPGDQVLWLQDHTILGGARVVRCL